jgi:hypothetical protein
MTKRKAQLVAEKAANPSAARLLACASISAALGELKAKLVARLHVTPQRLVEEAAG